MLRITLRLLATALVMSSGLAAAASKSAKADRVVETVLQQEARGAVTRRADDLGSTIEESDRARWAAGYVQMANDWQRFDVPVPVDERIRNYEQRRGSEPTTPQQHLALADWCRDHKLRDQERAHLWAVLASSPNQSSILRRLGFESSGGDWMTPREKQRLLAKESQIERDLAKWRIKSVNIRRQLLNNNPPDYARGVSDLMEITNDHAILVLESELSSDSPEVAGAFVQFLAKRDSLASTMALMRQSVLSPWESVRVISADQLRNRRSDHFVPTLLSSISTVINLRTLDFDPKHAIPLKINGSGSTSTILSWSRYQYSAVVNGAEITKETWHNSYNVIVQRVSPAFIFGPIGIKRILPDFHNGSGQQQLTQLNSQLLESEDGKRKFLAGLIVSENQAITAWNQRVADALTRSAQFPSGLSAKEMWHAWAVMNHTDPNIEKLAIDGAVTEVSEQPLVGYDPLSPSCLPSGTAIATTNGTKSIESLRIGDTVLAKDIETGELAYKPVIRTTVRSPQPLVTLHTKDDSIRATLGHYFWVSGKGWRMAKEIKAGDRLHGVQGTVTVTDVSPCGREAVYNLVVEEANSYFVGESRILSHDVTPPVPTDIIVPGLAAR